MATPMLYRDFYHFVYVDANCEYRSLMAAYCYRSDDRRTIGYFSATAMLRLYFISSMQHALNSPSSKLQTVRPVFLLTRPTKLIQHIFSLNLKLIRPT